MRNLLSIIIILGAFHSISQVENRSYSAMLYHLLDHSVEEVAVSDVSDSDDSVLFLDAREKKEFNVSHIKNAQWVGYDDFNMRRVKEIDKDEKIVIYCSVGYRSEKICEKLEKAGYTNVQNLYGSIFEWVNQGKPVYDNQGNKTDKVHAYNADWGQWLLKGKKVY